MRSATEPVGESRLAPGKHIRFSQVVRDAPDQAAVVRVPDSLIEAPELSRADATPLRVVVV